MSTIYGPVQGSLRVGEKSVNYYGFQGIRYVEPPIGDLRFKVDINTSASSAYFLAAISHFLKAINYERLNFLGSSISTAIKRDF